MNNKPISVTALVNRLKRIVTSDPENFNILVEGELSNLRKPYTGHWYFSLKDNNALIECVMFSSYNSRIDFPLKDGDSIIVKGNVDLYTKGGKLQLNVTDLYLSGIGDLYLKLEELKKKFLSEGLFDVNHKKELPKYPFSVGLITGNSTAALKDVLKTFKLRWPYAEVTLYPASVQGEGAPPQIIKQLNKADKENHDLLMLVRGGGSIEDLWCFNDEALGRCIYDLNTPIVTGIGHEIDTSIADLVADAYANTPTGAVEKATPDKDEVNNLLNNYRHKLVNEMNNIITSYRHDYKLLAQNRLFHDPKVLLHPFIIELQDYNEKLNTILNSINNTKNRLLNLNQRLNTNITSSIYSIKKKLSDDELNMKHAMNIHLNNSTNRLKQNIKLLDSYSPLKVLERGYAIVEKEDIPINNISMVNVGDDIDITLHKGKIKAEIKEINNE